MRLCDVSGKRCYPGRRSALKAHMSSSQRLGFYVCEHCRAFHVTGRDKQDGTTRRASRSTGWDRGSSEF